MTALQDDFDFYTVGTEDREFAGYDSSSDPTTLAPNFLVGGSKNVFKDDNNNITVRPGLKLFGTVDSTLNGIVSSYEFSTANGITVPIRMLASGALQYLYNDIWTTLKQLTLTRAVFTEWWDDVNQIMNLIMVNGDENIYNWTGAIASFASSASTYGNSVVAASYAGGSIVGTYGAGDILTIQSGDNNAKVRVVSVSGGGAITAIAISELGSGYSLGTYNTTNTGSATGATIRVDQVADTFTLTKQGTETWDDLKFNSSLTLNPADIDANNNGLIINGVEYSYFGGTSTTTLTGVFPNPNGIAVGTTIVQKMFTTSDTPGTGPNDFIATINNQLIVGSYTSPVVYFSSDSDFRDFVNGGDLLSGDPDQIVLDDLPRGIIVVGESAYIPAGSGNWYVCTPNTPLPVQQTLGANDRLVIIQVDKKVGAAKTAALAHEFLAAIADTIVYLGQDHQLRMFGIFKDLVSTKYPSVSLQLKQELIDEDFTGGALRAIGDNIYVIAPISGRTYIYQQRDDVDMVGNIVSKRTWQPPLEWNISRIMVIDDIEYGCSVSYPQLYQLWDTNQYHDDSPEGAMPYECIARFPYWHFKDRSKMGDIDKLYIEGYMPANTTLTATLRSDYLGATAVEDVSVSAVDDSAVLFTNSGILIGEAIVGNEILGGGNETTVTGTPKFRAVAQFKKHNCFEYQFELYSLTLDDQWKVACIGTNGSQVINNPVQLLKG